jgi:hypothetical protein
MGVNASLADKEDSTAHDGQTQYRFPFGVVRRIYGSKVMFSGLFKIAHDPNWQRKSNEALTPDRPTTA